MAKYCEETDCKAKAEYRISKRQFLQGRAKPNGKWLKVCAYHEIKIGNANDEARGVLNEK